MKKKGSNILKETKEEKRKRRREEVLKLIPMKRFGKAEEVASLAAYLMSENASYMTGQVISVNGGLC